MEIIPLKIHRPIAISIAVIGLILIYSLNGLSITPAIQMNYAPAGETGAPALLTPQQDLAPASSVDSLVAAIKPNLTDKGARAISRTKFEKVGPNAKLKVGDFVLEGIFQTADDGKSFYGAGFIAEFPKSWSGKINLEKKGVWLIKSSNEIDWSLYGIEDFDILATKFSMITGTILKEDGTLNLKASITVPIVPLPLTADGGYFSGRWSFAVKNAAPPIDSVFVSMDDGAETSYFAKGYKVGNIDFSDAYYKSITSGGFSGEGSLTSANAGKIPPGIETTDSQAKFSHTPDGKWEISFHSESVRVQELVVNDVDAVFKSTGEGELTGMFEMPEILTNWGVESPRKTTVKKQGDVFSAKVEDLGLNWDFTGGVKIKLGSSGLMHGESGWSADAVGTIESSGKAGNWTAQFNTIFSPEKLDLSADNITGTSTNWNNLKIDLKSMTGSIDNPADRVLILDLKGISAAKGTESALTLNADFSISYNSAKSGDACFEYSLTNAAFSSEFFNFAGLSNVNIKQDADGTSITGNMAEFSPGKNWNLSSSALTMKLNAESVPLKITGSGSLLSGESVVPVTGIEFMNSTMTYKVEGASAILNLANGVAVEKFTGNGIIRQLSGGVCEDSLTCKGIMSGRIGDFIPYIKDKTVDVEMNIFRSAGDADFKWNAKANLTSLSAGDFGDIQNFKFTFDSDGLVKGSGKIKLPAELLSLGFKDNVDAEYTSTAGKIKMQAPAESDQVLLTGDYYIRLANPAVEVDAAGWSSSVTGRLFRLKGVNKIWAFAVKGALSQNKLILTIADDEAEKNMNIDGVDYKILNVAGELSKKGNAWSGDIQVEASYKNSFPETGSLFLDIASNAKLNINSTDGQITFAIESMDFKSDLMNIPSLKTAMIGKQGDLPTFNVDVESMNFLDKVELSGGKMKIVLTDMRPSAIYGSADLQFAGTKVHIDSLKIDQSGLEFHLTQGNSWEVMPGLEISVLTGLGKFENTESGLKYNNLFGGNFKIIGETIPANIYVESNADYPVKAVINVQPIIISPETYFAIPELMLARDAAGEKIVTGKGVLTIFEQQINFSAGYGQNALVYTVDPADTMFFWGVPVPLKSGSIEYSASGAASDSFKVDIIGDLHLTHPSASLSGNLNLGAVRVRKGGAPVVTQYYNVVEPLINSGLPVLDQKISEVQLKYTSGTDPLLRVDSLNTLIDRYNFNTYFEWQNQNLSIKQYPGKIVNYDIVGIGTAVFSGVQSSKINGAWYLESSAPGELTGLREFFGSAPGEKQIFDNIRVIIDISNLTSEIIAGTNLMVDNIPGVQASVAKINLSGAPGMITADLTGLKGAVLKGSMNNMENGIRTYFSDIGLILQNGSPTVEKLTIDSLQIMMNPLNISSFRGNANTEWILDVLAENPSAFKNLTNLNLESSVPATDASINYKFNPAGFSFYVSAGEIRTGAGIDSGGSLTWAMVNGADYPENFMYNKDGSLPFAGNIGIAGSSDFTIATGIPLSVDGSVIAALSAEDNTAPMFLNARDVFKADVLKTIPDKVKPFIIVPNLGKTKVVAVRGDASLHCFKSELSLGKVQLLSNIMIPRWFLQSITIKPQNRTQESPAIEALNGMTIEIVNNNKAVVSGDEQCSWISFADPPEMDANLGQKVTIMGTVKSYTVDNFEVETPVEITGVLTRSEQSEKIDFKIYNRTAPEKPTLVNAIIGSDAASSIKTILKSFKLSPIEGQEVYADNKGHYFGDAYISMKDNPVLKMDFNAAVIGRYLDADLGMDGSFGDNPIPVAKDNIKMMGNAVFDLKLGEYNTNCPVDEFFGTINDGGSFNFNGSARLAIDAFGFTTNVSITGSAIAGAETELKGSLPLGQTIVRSEWGSELYRLDGNIDIRDLLSMTAYDGDMKAFNDLSVSFNGESKMGGEEKNTSQTSQFIKMMLNDQSLKTDLIQIGNYNLNIKTGESEQIPGLIQVGGTNSLAALDAGKSEEFVIEGKQITDRPGDFLIITMSPVNGAGIALSCASGVPVLTDDYGNSKAIEMIPQNVSDKTKLKYTVASADASPGRALIKAEIMNKESAGFLTAQERSAIPAEKELKIGMMTQISLKNGDIWKFKAGESLKNSMIVQLTDVKTKALEGGYYLSLFNKDGYRLKKSMTSLVGSKLALNKFESDAYYYLKFTASFNDEITGIVSVYSSSGDLPLEGSFPMMVDNCKVVALESGSFKTAVSSDVKSKEYKVFPVYDNTWNTSPFREESSLSKGITGVKYEKDLNECAFHITGELTSGQPEGTLCLVQDLTAPVSVACEGKTETIQRSRQIVENTKLKYEIKHGFSDNVTYEVVVGGQVKDASGMSKWIWSDPRVVDENGWEMNPAKQVPARGMWLEKTFDLTPLAGSNLEKLAVLIRVGAGERKFTNEKGESFKVSYNKSITINTYVKNIALLIPESESKPPVYNGDSDFFAVGMRETVNTGWNGQGNFGAYNNPNSIIALSRGVGQGDFILSGISTGFHSQLDYKTFDFPSGDHLIVSEETIIDYDFTFTDENTKVVVIPLLEKKVEGGWNTFDPPESWYKVPSFAIVENTPLNKKVHFRANILDFITAEPNNGTLAEVKAGDWRVRGICWTLKPFKDKKFACTFNDIRVYDPQTSEIAFYSQKQRGSFVKKFSLILPGNTKDISAGDFDNDGDLDCAVLYMHPPEYKDYKTGKLSLYYLKNELGGNFTGSEIEISKSVTVELPKAKTGLKLDALDINADGNLDLIMYYEQNGGLAAWLKGIGNGKFASEITELSGENFSISSLVWNGIDLNHKSEWKVSLEGKSVVQIGSPSSDGQSWIRNPDIEKTGLEVMTYGPDIELAAGRYMVSYFFEGKGCPTDAKIARLEICADNGNTPITGMLVNKNVSGEIFDLTDGDFNTVDPFCIEIALMKPAKNVEFRTYTWNTAELKLKKIEIEGLAAKGLVDIDLDGRQEIVGIFENPLTGKNITAWKIDENAAAAAPVSYACAGLADNSRSYALFDDFNSNGNADLCAFSGKVKLTSGAKAGDKIEFSAVTDAGMTFKSNITAAGTGMFAGDNGRDIIFAYADDECSGAVIDVIPGNGIDAGKFSQDRNSTFYDYKYEDLIKGIDFDYEKSVLKVAFKEGVKFTGENSPNSDYVRIAYTLNGVDYRAGVASYKPAGIEWYVPDFVQSGAEGGEVIISVYTSDKSKGTKAVNILRDSISFRF